MKKGYEYNKEWRIKHPETRYEGKKRYYQKTAWAANGKRRYTKIETHLIVVHKMPDTELASFIGRSVAGIQKKRCCLK